MQLAIHAAGINRIRVIGIDYDIAAFTTANRSPVAEGDLSVVATAGSTSSAAVLLRSVYVIRKIVVDGHVIELRSRLVVPGTPALAAVDADHCTLIAGHCHAVGIVRIDPHKVIVISARRAFDGFDCLATISRAIKGH